MQINKDELADQGWTVVRGFVPRSITIRMRTLMDDILGPPEKEKPETEYGWSSRELVWKAVTDAYERGTPVVDSKNYMHTIRHPIRNHDCEVLADIISQTGVVELHEDLLKSSNVKLMQQMLRRTDVDPDAEKIGHSVARGWHMDHGFIPKLYESEPRQMYYHTMTALNDIGLDGAPFTVAGPDVYSRIKAVMRRFDDEYMSTLVGEDFRGAVPGRIMQAPEMVELREAITVPGCEPPGIEMGEGDMIVFDPCILHSATNAEKTRYAYFATYFDAAADYILLPQRGATAPSFKYPPEMKASLSPRHRSILDWAFPDDGHSNYDDRLRFEHFGDLISATGRGVVAKNKPDEFEGGARFGLAAGESVESNGASGSRSMSKL